MPREDLAEKYKKKLYAVFEMVLEIKQTFFLNYKQQLVYNLHTGSKIYDFFLMSKNKVFF